MQESKLTTEEVEFNVNQKKQAQKELIAQLDDLFQSAGLLKAEKLNNISYGYSDADIRALFSVDNSTLDASCYISSTDKILNINYNDSCDMDDLVDCAYRFLEELNDLKVELDSN